MDLPGAVGKPITIDKVPDSILKRLDVASKAGERLVKDKQNPPLSKQSAIRPFSLAEVQTKFSMRQLLTTFSQRFTLPLSNQNELLGDWIVKTPIPANQVLVLDVAEPLEIFQK